MISYIEGPVLHIGETFAIISANGLGYKVFAAQDTLASLQGKGTCSLWTYLAVRENALDLYGFANQEALAFFELLITISGIGPKTALSILNLANIRTLKSAIVSGDPTRLTKISGIGKKNAEKIVMELKDKVDGDAGDENSGTDDTDALEALRSLGYSERESREALKKVPASITETGKRIKDALKRLGNK